MENYIIYQGAYYTIEWYYDSRKRSQAFDYYDEQTASRKAKFIALVKRMADYGKIEDEVKFRKEGDGIYAFKPQPDRYLCFFFKGKKIVITNAFVKKTQKLPDNEKERALRLYKDYEKRIAQGIYYDIEKK